MIMGGVVTELAKGKSIFVFLGESGSGKSEIAVNWALQLAEQGKKVRFFDMDQTKPIFRSREVKAMLRHKGIWMDEYKQLLDAPTVPDAVFDRIQDPGSYAVLDVGGNAIGARSIGQFAAAWGDAMAAFMVINCYRPWSGQQQAMLQTIGEVAAAARVKAFSIISNPNFGAETSVPDILTGHTQVEELLVSTPYAVSFLTVQEQFRSEIREQIPDVDILGINRYMKTPWGN